MLDLPLREAWRAKLGLWCASRCSALLELPLARLCCAWLELVRLCCGSRCCAWLELPQGRLCCAWLELARLGQCCASMCGALLPVCGALRAKLRLCCAELEQPLVRLCCA